MADDRNSVSMKLKIAFSGTKYFNAFYAGLVFTTLSTRILKFNNIRISSYFYVYFQCLVFWLVVVCSLYLLSCIKITMQVITLVKK